MNSSLADSAQIQSNPGVALSAWLANCAPKGTAFAVSGIRQHKPHSDDEVALVSAALSVRKREFETGRHLARQALARLGCGATEILADADHVPLWPAGYVGSISHSALLCLAGVGQLCDYLTIGVDLEPDKPLDSTMAALICRSEELARAGQSGAMPYFVAKEAFYKAYFPVVRQFLDFSDVAITFNGAGLFQARLVTINKPKLGPQNVVQGHITLLEGHYVAIIWV